MSSSVILASNIGSSSSIKGISNKKGIGLCQSCDIVIRNERDDKPLQNAVTATCVSICLRDQAHTKESARALKEMIKKDFAEKRLVFVIAMASDKDHLSFAKELLSGLKPEAVVLTETDIGGGKARSTECSVLKESWIKAVDELGLGLMEASENKNVFGSLKLAYKILSDDKTGDSGMVIVTGSLHIVSSVLASHQH